MQRKLRESVAVYTSNYLTISMTFIYRQIIGVSKEFDVVVVTTRTENIDQFPFDPIRVVPRNLVDKVSFKIHHNLFRKLAPLGPCQKSKIGRALKQYQPALIHAHFGPAGLEVLPLARSLRIPLIVTFHGHDASSMLKNSAYVKDLQGLFEYAEIVAVSQNMAEKLVSIGANPAKLHVHYYGIPTEFFKYVERVPVREKAASGKPIEFLQVSNFVEKKGHEYTIRAFQGFLQHYPNAQLRLAGDGPLRPQMEQLCRELDMEQNVHFAGKVSQREVLPLMESADVFLHHSITANNGDQEGIPNAIMEAMATGLIPISTFHSGIPELINNGVNGFLVEEKDVRQYTNKMLGVLDCGSDITALASSTVRTSFDLEKQNLALQDIYRRVLCKYR